MNSYGHWWSSPKQFVLVICDYATHFPKAIPMRSVDSVHVAEELLVFCSRFGVLQEILTDQGAFKAIDRAVPNAACPSHSNNTLPSTDGRACRTLQ